MSIEEIEAKFKEMEDGYDKIEELNDEFNEEFNDFIASLQELVY